MTSDQAHGRSQLTIRAMLLTLVIVLLGNAAVDVATGRWPGAGGTLGFIDAPDVLALHLLFTGLPLIILAALRVDHRAVWWTATALVAASWCYLVWQMRQDYLAGFDGGTRIGLGMTMTAAQLAILVFVAILSVLSRIKSRSKG